MEGKKNLLSFDHTTVALRVNFKIPREGKWSTQSCTAQPMLRAGTNTTYPRKYVVWRRQWDGIPFLFWEPESRTSGSFHLSCDLDSGAEALFSSQKQQNWWQRLGRGSLEACAAPEGWLSRDTLSFIFSLKAWVWVSASYGSAFSWWILSSGTLGTCLCGIHVIFKLTAPSLQEILCLVPEPEVYINKTEVSKACLILHTLAPRTFSPSWKDREPRTFLAF